MMRKLIVLSALLPIIGGCATKPAQLAPPAPVSATTCLPLKTYTPDQQKQAAAELSKLPNGSMVVRMVTDYGAMRDADRACLSSK